MTFATDSRRADRSTGRRGGRCPARRPSRGCWSAQRRRPSASELRLKASPWTTTTGRRKPGSDPAGSARSAHHTSPWAITTRIRRGCAARPRGREGLCRRSGPPRQRPRVERIRDLLGGAVPGDVLPKGRAVDLAARAMRPAGEAVHLLEQVIGHGDGGLHTRSITGVPTRRRRSSAARSLQCGDSDACATWSQRRPGKEAPAFAGGRCPGGSPMATEPACLLIADISGYTGYLAGCRDPITPRTSWRTSWTRSSARSARLPAREARGRRRVHVRDHRDGSTGRLLLDTDRALLLRLPAASPRRAPGDVVRVQRVRAHPGPQPEVRRSSRHDPRQRVAGREELLGSDVIVVHRLLKNTVVETTGFEAYALFSQPCVDAMDVDVAALGMRPMSETYDHIGEVPVMGSRPRAALAGGGIAHARHRRRGPVRFKVPSIPTSAPPQVAWEFVTVPGAAAFGGRSG